MQNTFKNILIKTKENRGFVILMAVTLASIMLSISMGVANIVFRELKFSTSARAGNDAFFAADNGIECALYSDKYPTSSFPVAGPVGVVACASAVPTYTAGTGTGLYTFVVVGLGSTGSSCAKVTVFKDSVSRSPYTVTTVTSKGYDVGNAACDSSNPDRVEREIKASY